MAISQPPMTYRPESDQTKYLAPISRSINETSRQSPTTPTIPKPVSLGRQIHEAYDFRSPTSHESRDLESMSDRTSASYSRATSVNETKYQSVYSPTFSHASRLEAGRYSHGGGGGTHSPGLTSPRDHGRRSGPVFEYTPPEDDHDPKNDHAVRVLIWLALFDPLYSLIGAVYALAAVLILLILTPLRLCDSSCSFKRSTIQLLSPILNKHLRLLKFETHEYTGYKASALVMIYLFAPFISFGVSVAAWVSASFWVFALIMGNPDGTERGDDGQKTILAVRNWWAGYLTKALLR